MTHFEGVLGLQVEAMLEAIRRQRDERCREIVVTAERRAKQALAQSRGRLCKRQRRALAEERERRNHELHVTASHLETRARQRAHARYRRVLEDGWPRLLTALEARWANAESRRAWCDMIVAEAAGALNPAVWLVEHPESWPRAEHAVVTGLLEDRGLPAPGFRADAGMKAGLRIRAGTACLDGTPAGLLSARQEVEALLLAMWERQRSGTDGDG